MSVQNKKNRSSAYKLIFLCVAAITLGCVLPIFASLIHSSTSRGVLTAMEAAGGIVLAYVFGLYLVKR